MRKRSQHWTWRRPVLQSHQITSQPKGDFGNSKVPLPRLLHIHAHILHSLPTSAKSGVPPRDSTIPAMPQIKGSPGSKSRRPEPPTQLTWLGATWAHPWALGECLGKGHDFSHWNFMQVLIEKAASHCSLFSEAQSSAIHRRRLASFPGGPLVPPPCGSRRTHLLGTSLTHHPQGGFSEWRKKQLVGLVSASARLLAGWEWAAGQAGAAAGLGLRPRGVGPAWTRGGTDGASVATEAKINLGAEGRRSGKDRTVPGQASKGVFLSKPGNSKQLLSLSILIYPTAWQTRGLSAKEKSPKEQPLSACPTGARPAAIS